MAADDTAAKGRSGSEGLVAAAIEAQCEMAELRSFAGEMLQELRRLGPGEVMLLDYYKRRGRELGI